MCNNAVTSVGGCPVWVRALYYGKEAGMGLCIAGERQGDFSTAEERGLRCACKNKAAPTNFYKRGWLR